MTVNKEFVSKCGDEMIAELAKLGAKSENLEKLKKNFQASTQNIPLEAIAYCIEKFVQSELDYQTQGSRGLGRSSDHWPRLGAYFRKAFTGLSAEEVKELDVLLTSLVMKCYLFLILVADNPKEVSKTIPSATLYEKWVPQIYTFDFSGMSENTGNLMLAVAHSPLELTKNFLRAHGMKSGFFGGDKTDEILNGYITAGIALRASEKS